MHRGRRKGKTAIRNSTSRGLGPISIDPNALMQLVRLVCPQLLGRLRRFASPTFRREAANFENFDVTSEVGVRLGEVGIDIEHSSVVVAPMTPSRSCSISATQAPSPTGRFTFTRLPSVAKGCELAALSLLGPAALRCCCRCQSPRTIAGFSVSVRLPGLSWPVSSPLKVYTSLRGKSGLRF